MKKFQLAISNVKTEYLLEAIASADVDDNLYYKPKEKRNINWGLIATVAACVAVGVTAWLFALNGGHWIDKMLVAFRHEEESTQERTETTVTAETETGSEYTIDENQDVTTESEEEITENDEKDSGEQACVHNFIQTADDSEYSYPANCFCEGILRETCTICGCQCETVIPKLEHKFVDGLCTLCGLSETAETDFEYNYSSKYGGLILGHKNNAAWYESEAIELPAYAGYGGRIHPIVAIESNLFKSNAVLEKIFIPDTYKYIGKSAFDHCTNLSQVRLSGSLSEIGDYAFNYCTALTDIYLPDGLMKIGQMGFSYCTGLTKLEIPDSVSSIGNNAFENDTKLTKIHLPESLTEISMGMFLRCTSMKTLTIPEKVKTIGGMAFMYSGLEAVDLPAGLKTLKEHAFAEMPIKSIVLPDGVTKLGGCVIHDCPKLEELVLPTTLTSLGQGEIQNLPMIKRLDIPKSLTKADRGALTGLTGLEEITVDRDNTAFTVKNGFLINLENGSLICGLATENLVIPDGLGIVSVAEQAFAYSDIIKTVKISGGIQSIGIMAFSDCGNLTEVTLEEGVTFIGAGSFQNCPKLKKISIPSTAANLSLSTVINCENLREMEINTSSGVDCFFAGVPKLETIRYKYTVQSWKNNWAKYDFGSLSSPVGDYKVICSDGVYQP